MKFYPTADPWFYVEKQNCFDKYQKYPANYSWKIPKKDKEPTIMYHWRDFDGVKLEEVKREDLCFENWPTTRIRKEACLGMLYATGNRFIKVGNAKPNDFKCAPLPVNLATARIIKKELADQKNLERKQAKEAKLAKQKDVKLQKGKGSKKTVAKKR